MSQNSPVPEWFGKAEAEQLQTSAARKRGAGCGLGALLVLLAGGSLYWAITAQLRVNQLEERLRSQERELARRPAPAIAPPAPATAPPAPATAPPAPAIAPPAPVTAEPAPVPEVPAPAPDDTPAEGQRSAAAIQKELTRLRPAFRRCYDVVLKDDPTLNGRINVALVISPAGRVTSASASTTGNLPPPVGACVAQVARTASFGPADASTTVNYPLVFQPR